jgi:hypothetical protein
LFQIHAKSIIGSFKKIFYIRAIDIPGGGEGWIGYYKKIIARKTTHFYSNVELYCMIKLIIIVPLWAIIKFS